jgi:hypothetical protein
LADRTAAEVIERPAPTQGNPSSRHSLPNPQQTERSEKH